MKRKTLLVISSALIVLFAVVLSACAKTQDAKSALIGSWEFENAPDAYFSFNEDGTGTFFDGTSPVNLTYAVDGDNLSISYQDIEKPRIYEHTLKEGMLTLKDVESADVFTLKKK